MVQKHMEVYDLMYRRLGFLTDNTDSSANKITEEYKINGVDVINFSLPLKSDKWKYVLNENLVKFGGQYYVIKLPKFNHSLDVKDVTVECRHLSSNLEGILNPEYTALEGAGKSAKELVQMVLDGSGWSVGDIDIPDEKKRGLVVKEQSVLTNLIKIAELFDAELSFSATDYEKVVHLKQTPVDRKIQIRRNKNLQSLYVEYDTTEMVTKLHVTGAVSNITGKEITIFDAVLKDENGDIIYEKNDDGSYKLDGDGNKIPKLYGKSYIEDYSFYLSQGYDIDYIKAHPELFLKEMAWNATDYVDVQMLYDDAVKKMQTICKPKVRCTVEGVDLSVFPKWFVDSPQKGEIIYIYDDMISGELKTKVDENYQGEAIQAKVVSIKKDSSKPIGLKIELSNEIEYSSIVKQLVDTSAQIKKIVNTSGLVEGSYLSGVIDMMNAKLNSTKSHWYTDDSGSIIFENDTKTSAMKLGGGVFGISNKKDVNGKWLWSTFGDGDGFVADHIIAGLLKGGNVEWNLDNVARDILDINGSVLYTLPAGALLIGKDTTDYSLYYDGTNLRFGKGAITWDNLDNSAKDNLGAVNLSIVGGTRSFTFDALGVCQTHPTAYDIVAIRNNQPIIPKPIPTWSYGGFLSGDSATPLVGNYTTNDTWVEASIIINNIVYTERIPVNGSKMGSDGIKGDTGASIRIIGQWDNTGNTKYYCDDKYIDVVTDNGNSYACKQTHSGTPVKQLTDTNYWTLLTKKGDNGFSAYDMNLSTDNGVVFKFDGNGTNVGIQDTTITCNPVNVIPTSFEWKLNGTVIAGETKNSYKFIPSSFDKAESCVITCTITGLANGSSITLADSISLVKTVDGSDSYNAILSNESLTIACDNAGTPVQPLSTNAFTDVTLYKGTEVINANYGTDANGLTKPSFVACEGNITTKSVNGKIVLTITLTSVTQDNASVSIPIYDGTKLVATKLFTVAKSKQGALGLNAYSVNITASNGDVFKVKKDGSCEITDTQLTCNTVNVLPTKYVWKKNGTIISGQTGNSITVSLADFGSSSSIVYTCVVDGTVNGKTITGLTDSQTILKVVDGVDGNSLTAQYSIDGLTNWHNGFQTGDVYMRQSLDGGTTWSSVIKVTGDYIHVQYCNAMISEDFVDPDDFVLKKAVDTTVFVDDMSTILLLANSNNPNFSMVNYFVVEETFARYFFIRYKVKLPPTDLNAKPYPRIYFYSDTYTSISEEARIDGDLYICDNQWHTMVIDAWKNPKWKTSGDVRGWRVDWAVNGQNMEIAFDYFTLAQYMTPNSCNGFLGTYTDHNPTDSTDVKSYNWTRVFGKNGKVGDKGNFVETRFTRSESLPSIDSKIVNPPNWTIAPPTGNNGKLWMSTSTKNADGTELIVEWSTPVQIEGVDAYNILASNENMTFSADVSGNVISYNGANTEIHLFRGSKEINANITMTPSNAIIKTSLTNQLINGITVYKIAVTDFPKSIDSGYIDITVQDGTNLVGTKRMTLSKSKTGSTGISFRNRSIWDSTLNYVNDNQYIDVVSWNGCSWACAVSNNNSEPTKTNTNWTLLSEQGQIGKTYCLNILGGTRTLTYNADNTKPSGLASTQFTFDLYEGTTKVTNGITNISWSANGHYSGALQSSTTFTPTLSNLYDVSKINTYITLSLVYNNNIITTSLPIAVSKNATGLDWVDDWNGQTNVIDGKRVVSPKMFAGSKDADGHLTGVAIGRELVSGSGLQGIIGYSDNVPTFKISTDGSAVFGLQEEDKRQIKILSNGKVQMPEIDAQKIVVTSGENLDTKLENIESKANENDVLTVDNVNDYYFSFDKNLCSSAGLNPIDDTVSMSKNGVYGGSVAVLENVVNLISNPTFEPNSDVSPTNWLCSTSDTTQVKYTSYDKMLTIKRLAQPTPDECQGAYQDINVNPNTTYTFSCEAKRSEGSSNNCAIVIGGDGAYNKYTVTQIDKFEWATFYTTFTTSADAKTVRIYFKVGVVNDVIQLRNVQLENRNYYTPFTESSRVDSCLRYDITSLDYFSMMAYKRNIYSKDYFHFALTKAYDLQLGKDVFTLYENGVENIGYKDRWKGYIMQNVGKDRYTGWDITKFSNPSTHIYMQDGVILHSYSSADCNAGFLFRTFVYAQDSVTIWHRYACDNAGGIRINNGTPISIGGWNWEINPDIRIDLVKGWNVVEIWYMDTDALGGSLRLVKNSQGKNSNYGTNPSDFTASLPISQVAQVQYMTAEIPIEFSANKLYFNEKTNCYIDEMMYTSRAYSAKELFTIFNSRKPFYDPAPKSHAPKPNSVNLQFI